MNRLAARALREAYRRELMPPAVLWSLAGAGVRDWIRGLDRPLREPLGSKEAARDFLTRIAAEMFRRRYDALAEKVKGLPPRADDERAPALAMAALHQLDLAPKARWLWDGIGGAPRSLRERARAQQLVWPMSPEARWIEVAGHLGELLIVFTETAMKPGSPLLRGPQVLGQVCFEMGVRYAEQVVALFGLPVGGDDRAERAIEVLRMGEYVFRVNPQHWKSVPADPKAPASLEGTACLWWSRPGWQRMHCGIFGQFQAGVCSVFGLDYKLDKTIPKHGGSTCRISMSPLLKV